MDHFAWPIAIIPEIRTAGRFALADRGHETRYRGATHALHLHDYGGEMRLAGTVRRLEPGDVTISPAGAASSYHLPVRGHHWCVHFIAGAEAVATVDLALHAAGGDAAGSVRERMAGIAALFQRGRDDAVAATSAGLALQSLLLWLAGRTGEAQPPGAAERAAAVIDARFAEPLDIAAIAAAAGCAPAYLSRAFRRRYGETAAHRLIARRMEHARYLLESTDLPVWRVAERVGIPDAPYFNKTVRRFLGASPSAVRMTGGGGTIDPDR